MDKPDDTWTHFLKRLVLLNLSEMVVVSSLGPPEEGIHHTEEGTTTYVNEKCLGKGTLYVSESRVSWVGDAGHKFSLEYPHISLHAVSRVRFRLYRRVCPRQNWVLVIYQHLHVFKLWINYTCIFLNRTLLHFHLLKISI